MQENVKPAFSDSQDSLVPWDEVDWIFGSLIFGTRVYGTIDCLPNRFCVGTYFWHVFWLPIIPRGSWLFVTAARMRKMKTEQRISAMCVQFGGTISLSDGDRGWITELHFASASNLNDEHLRELAKLKDLKTLYLNVTQVTGDGLEALAHFPALRELHVNESQLTTDGIRHLQALHQLRKIGFWGSSSDDPRAKQILRSLPNVKPYP